MRLECHLCLSLNLCTTSKSGGWIWYFMCAKCMLIRSFIFTMICEQQMCQCTEWVCTYYVIESNSIDLIDNIPSVCSLLVSCTDCRELRKRLNKLVAQFLRMLSCEYCGCKLLNCDFRNHRNFVYWILHTQTQPTLFNVFRFFFILHRLWATVPIH